MALLSPTRKLTYEDYLRIPDDGKRHEILDGVHYVTASPYLRHQHLLGELYLELGNYLRRRRLGKLYLAPSDVLLSENDVVVPDLIFVSDRRSRILTEANVRGAPDLAVEVLSPSTRQRDRTLKRDRYELFGVGEYWLVDPIQDSVTVYRREGDAFGLPVKLTAEAGDRLSSPLFPGLEIALRELFAR